MIELEDIERAQKRIQGVATRTPLIAFVKAQSGGHLWLKPESLQPIGAFKLRGAYNKMASLTEQEKARGVIAFSSGNHAQGVAYAARALGIEATIVMPAIAPQIKKEKTLALYDAEIAFVDEQVEALLAGLAEQLRPDPIVVLYSDHGEGLYDHPGVPNTREHGFVLYESNLHVPLVFHHSSLASSRRIVEPVELVDIAPTLLDLAGLPVPPELEGTSLAPELRDQGQVTRPPFTVAHTDRSYVSKASIVEADIKLIINRDTEALATNPDADLKKRERKHLELTDPVEVYDLAALRAQGKKERPGKTQIDADPELVQRLRATLETWEAAHPVRPPTRAADDTITPELMEQLKALGYVQ